MARPSEVQSKWVAITLVTLSFAILAILLVVAVHVMLVNEQNMMLIYGKYMTYSSLLGDENLPRPLLMQHGDYWVFRNFASGANIVWYKDYTLTMQGTYQDIYKLIAFYTGETGGLYVSFAVYVPDESHFNRTLEAMAYVRNCTSYETNGPQLITEKVAFHLYFRQDQLKWNVHRLGANVKINCQKLSEALHESNESDEYDKLAQSAEETNERNKRAANTSSHNIASTVVQDHSAIIVGMNIAQLAAPTKYILNTDVDTFPATAFFARWLNMQFNCMSETGKKQVFRVPIVSMQLRKSEIYLARMDKSYTNQRTAKEVDSYPLPNNVWMKDKYHFCSPNYSLQIAFEQLFSLKQHFLGSRLVIPLLPEHKGLSVEDSELFRLYSIALQNFDVIITMDAYMLHNATFEEKKPRQKFKKIHTKILQQYETLFGAQKI